MNSKYFLKIGNISHRGGYLTKRFFTFQTTKNILFELGSSNKVGSLLKDMGIKKGKRILIVTDAGIIKAKLDKSCINSILNEGYEYEIFSKVVADPPSIVINDAVNFAKSKDIAGVIGLGGGSSMDVAKLVAFLSYDQCQQSIENIYGVNQCIGNRLPLLQIPTTAGTGSEVTPISIITTGSNEKKGIVSSVLLPDWAIIDGELTLSVPPNVSAATGIDAMVHAIEAMTSKIKKNPISDMFAIQALELLSKNIRIVCIDGKNSQARAGSMYAGMAFANSPVGAVHALAYPIGSHFHIPHGLSNSLMLPHIIRFNSIDDNCSKIYNDIAKIIFPKQNEIPLKDFDIYDALSINERMAIYFELLAKYLEIPTKLRDVGIKETDLILLATEAMKQTRLLPNNARELNFDDALELYRKAY